MAFLQSGKCPGRVICLLLRFSYFLQFMKIKSSIYIILLLIVSIKAIAQPDSTVTKQGKYTLTFINLDPTFDPGEKQRMITTFFTVYPELANAYNRKTAREVKMVIDIAYKGVAETDNGRVTISSRW